MLFRSFYPWSAQVWKPSYPPFLKGQLFNVSGEGLLEILRKNPSDLERRENDRFYLCCHHKQKFCLIYTHLGCETKTLSRKNLSSSPQRLNGWMNVVCYETNSQSEQEQTMVIVGNKNGGIEGFCRSLSDNKSIKITGSSIETRLLSVRTYRTDLQEYLASFKRTLCQCCYWSVRTCIYTSSTVVWYCQSYKRLCIHVAFDA